MEGKLVQNEQTGEVAIWDGKQLNKLPGRLVTNEKTGGKALWDGKNLTPVKIDIDPKQPTAAADQAMMQKLASPQDIALKTSSTGFAPAQPQSPLQVMETLNAPFDLAGDVAGRAVQNLVDPVKNPMLSDVAGGLTKAAIQYAGPQMVTTGVKGALKLATMMAPGAQGGKMESLIGKTQGAMESGLSRAQKSQAGFERAVSKIPEGSRTPLTNTLSTLDKLIASEEAAGIKDATFLRDAKRIRDKIQSGTKDLRWVDAELTRIGKKTKAVLGVDANPGYKQLFAAMADDLERPTRAAAPLTQPIKEVGSRGVVVRAKDQAIRRTKGFEDLIDEFNNLVKTKRGQAGAQDINANQLMDKLKKNEFLTESLRPEDWKEITPLLTKLADTAALPAARGVGYGSGRALSRGAIAGGIASMTGMDPLTTAAAFTGIDYATGHLLMTRSGRSMVKAVLEMKAYSPSQKLNIINGMGLLAEKSINKAMEQ